MNRLACLLFAFVPLSSFSAQTEQDALSYLSRMSEALHSLNYHGTLVYIHDGQVESMQLIHKLDKDGEFERLVHLSGEPREVIRNDDVVTCYLPDSQSVVVGQRRFNNHLIAKLTSNLERFAPNYSFSVNDVSRVAGKNARMIAIEPKDPYRYGYRVWVDEKTHLLLKTELLDTEGKVLEQIMFANIEIVDKIPDAMLQPAVSGESFTWHGQEKEAGGAQQADLGWKVETLPSGFIVSGQYKQIMPNSKQPADHMVISDGLASVSVYIEPFGVDSQAFVGPSRMGAINVFGSVFQDYQITVVGEVPQPTVEMIAQSIKYQNTAADND